MFPFNTVEKSLNGKLGTSHARLEFLLYMETTCGRAAEVRNCIYVYAGFPSVKEIHETILQGVGCNMAKFVRGKMPKR